MVHNVHRQAAVKNGVFELPAFTLKEHLGYCACACVCMYTFTYSSLTVRWGKPESWLGKSWIGPLGV